MLAILGGVLLGFTVVGVPILVAYKSFKMAAVPSVMGKVTPFNTFK